MFYELVGVICFVYVIWTLWFKKVRESEPPVLSGRLPILGHGHRFLCDSTELLKTLDTLAEESLKKGGVSSIYMGLWKTYVVTDPEDSLTISNKCLDKDYIYKFTKSFLGDGLVTADEAIWKRHRKLLNPAFSQAVLNSFISTFNSQAKLLVDRFAEEVGRPFDHEESLRLINLETICMTAMGTEGGEYSNIQKQYVPLIGELLKVITERFTKVWLHNNFIFNMSPLKKKQDQLVQRFMELCRTIIITKREEMKMNAGQQSKSCKTKPFLELMLDITNETQCLTDEEIRDETNNIILAGHDTSASILTFVFVLLGSYPEVQQRVYKEVLDVFKNTDECDKDGISKLVYTEAVIKETVRLYPIAPIIARYIDKPLKLKNYTLDANSSCFLFLGAINRHPIWGPDADQFKPERWLDSATLPNPEFFGGFGLGRRACIGRMYAIMSMKILVAHVIHRYRISADVSKMVLKWDLMARPKCGHYITLTSRNNGI